MRIFALALGLVTCAAEPPAITGERREATVSSAIVGADYQLLIRLPPGYSDDAERTYPLVVQLDPTFLGHRKFEITAGLISERAGEGSWPEAIVVGIDDVGPNQRLRDYVLPTPLDPAYAGGSADRFYAALEGELLPWIEGELRVDPQRRILVGHSAGATFAWYTALRHAPPEPPLFAGILAADVGIEEGLFTYERWHAARSTSLPLRLYAASAVYNGAVQKVTMDAMSERLASRDYTGFDFTHETFETDHGGIVLLAFEAGLGFLLVDE